MTGLEAPDILTRGEWKPDTRGVLRWVPAPHVFQIPERQSTALLIACPFCRALAGQTCKSSGGNPVLPHACHLVGRYCLCGAPLFRRKGTRRKMCDACRDEAARESKREARARRAKCGTDSGYRRHRRLGQPACPSCLAAHALLARERRDEEAA